MTQTFLFLWLAIVTLLFTLPAKGGYFSAIIYEMDAHQDFISRPIINDTRNNNFYTVSAWKISRPGNGNEIPITGGDKDLIWSPLKFTLQPNGREYFKLYYRGPKDNVERYYRVVFKETPAVLFPWRSPQKDLDIIPVVAMSTLLIVRPRETNLKYEIDEKSGTISNTGNTFFRVILQNGCNGDDESSTQFYMLPGETWNEPKARSNNRKYIVALGRYHQLGSGCFN
ncbi:molecular chaperone [Kluyvera cryocrescens]|uniref:molecular chaperone n=1 Tax=Kluyvera cryocrescens TaxID=580 RepID=UPI0028BDC846|nr:molecular chaperone [Kluyvera cryocrescens]WNN73835.1 molecular chaperone [Kluyvera cryocrescens]